MSQDVMTQMIVPAESLTIPFVVTNKWSLPCVLTQVCIKLLGRVIIDNVVEEGADNPPGKREGWQERGWALGGCDVFISDAHG